MRLPEVEQVARDIVPGRRPPRLELLAHGMYHDSYRVFRDSVSYLLRVARACADGLASRIWEAKLLAAAQAAHLAPAMLCVDAKRGVLLYRWIEGGFWSDADTRQERRIAQVAGLIRAIQQLAVPEQGPCMSPADWVNRYRGALKNAGRPAGQALGKLANERLQALGPITAIAICHSDLHRFNLLQTPAAPMHPGVLLLDWEYAHRADIYWDLAGWSANNDFDAALQERLLQNFLGRPAASAEFMRLSRLTWLYDYVCLLWSELYLTLRPGPDAARFTQRAAQLEMRLR